MIAYLLTVMRKQLLMYVLAPVLSQFELDCFYYYFPIVLNSLPSSIADGYY